MYIIYAHIRGDVFSGYKTKCIGFCETLTEAKEMAVKHGGWFEWEDMRERRGVSEMLLGEE